MPRTLAIAPPTVFVLEEYLDQNFSPDSPLANLFPKDQTKNFEPLACAGILHHKESIQKFWHHETKKYDWTKNCRHKVPISIPSPKGAVERSRSRLVIYELKINTDFLSYVFQSSYFEHLKFRLNACFQILFTKTCCWLKWLLLHALKWKNQAGNDPSRHSPLVLIYLGFQFWKIWVLPFFAQLRFSRKINSLNAKIFLAILWY